MHECTPAAPFCSYVGVAFLRGNPRTFWDRVIMDFTRGPFVHTEFFLQHGKDVRFYTAANLVDCTQNPSGFLPSAKMHALPDDRRWDIVKFPVSYKGYLVAYALVLQLLALQLPYNARDLWQCSVNLLLPYERDLDYRRFDTWQPRGVFCSQVCLLLLRRLHSDGVIALPPSTCKQVYGVNSRGCSPNALRALLS